jgi:hypothetical protein
MNKSLRNGLLFSLGLVLAVCVSAKDIKVSVNNTPYTLVDVQKLASTAVKMGVTEPVNLRLNGGNLTVSGSSKTICVIKVGEAATPQIAGINCK